MEFSGCANDDSLGPAVQGCRDDFDFTIKFESIAFMLIPAVAFILISIPRIVYLARRPIIVDGRPLQVTKLIAIGVYGILRLGLLVQTTLNSTEFDNIFIASATATFASVLVMLATSYLEHSRSPKPAALLNAYLFITLFLDVCQSRTLWLSSTSFNETIFSRLFVSTVAIKAFLIVLESRQKSAWLHWDIKQHSPEETSGLYSLGAFAWLNKLFLRGYKKTLTLDDLYPLDQSMTSSLLQVKLAKLVRVGETRKHSLAIATAKALAIPLLLPVVPRIALGVFQFCQPILLNSLLVYLEVPAQESIHSHGYGLVGATGFTYIGIATSGAFYWYFQQRAMYMARGALASMVYQKTIEAKLSATDDLAPLTLMSTDVERVIRGLTNIHELWANLIEVAVASWLLYNQIGLSFLAPLVIIACCAGLTSFVTNLTGPRQKAWMEKIEKRVGLTSTIIGQMKHLKISGLANRVEDSIHQMRVEELQMGSRFRMVTVWSIILGYFPAYISPVGVFAFAGRTLDITTIFTSMSYIGLLTNPLVNLFMSIPTFNASFTCLNRIQIFLAKDSRVDFRKSTRVPSSARTVTSNLERLCSAMDISTGNFGWQQDKFSLKNIDLSIPASRLTIIIGPVASGKSTLCKALLGETPFSDGEISMNTTLLSERIGYCEQAPHLSNTTIRQNIVGFSAFDEERYTEVIEASMLHMDLAVLPDGDQTNVGSKGIALSGGQKSRVAIARALYIDSKFLIFDDVLSGLDADIEQQVFRRIFSPTGLLRRRNTTAVLCTHSVKHLPSADHIVALSSNGDIAEQGTFQDLMRISSGYVYSLGITESASQDVDDPNVADLPEGFKVRDNHRRPQALAAKSAKLTPKEERKRMMGDGTVYRHYFAHVSPWMTALAVIFSIGRGFGTNFDVVYLKFWSEDVTSADPTHSNAFYIGFFALVEIFTLVCLFVVCAVVLVSVIQVSGAALHKEALVTVINAPLKFFTTTDTGIVTNLFSQDMTLIDGALPTSLLNVALLIPSCIGIAAVMAASSPFLIITYPILGAVLFCVQMFYLRTSRQIRLLDLEAKSPLYTHFIDTIKGVVTFRAFGWVQDCINHNHNLLDTSQRPAYLLVMIQHWLAFTLQLVVAALALVLVTLSTQLRLNTACTGASLVLLMSFGEQLSILVQMWTLLETSIGAVSRLKTFTDKVVSENKEGEDIVPPRGWPLEGRIEMRGVSASYDTTNESSNDAGILESSPHLAIKNLTLSIAPHEKVAICGSSGSGKSSTLLLLLKILDPVPSALSVMTIDSISLDKIDRETLRQSIIAIPQDAVFLPDGTSFQVNLDPFHTSSEADCRAVLETVNLWPFVEHRGGLVAGMSPDMLSVGQKQLFSLARAVLRARTRARERAAEFGEEGIGATAGGILLLDEFNSSMDQDTDRTMQGVIHTEFNGYTIIMVSHRLDMVMEFDTVVVMDCGEIVEVGVPKELAEREGGRFRALCLAGHSG